MVRRLSCPDVPDVEPVDDQRRIQSHRGSVELEGRGPRRGIPKCSDELADVLVISGSAGRVVGGLSGEIEISGEEDAVYIVSSGEAHVAAVEEDAPRARGDRTEGTCESVNVFLITRRQPGDLEAAGRGDAKRAVIEFEHAHDVLATAVETHIAAIEVEAGGSGSVRPCRSRSEEKEIGVVDALAVRAACQTRDRVIVRAVRDEDRPVVPDVEGVEVS